MDGRRDNDMLEDREVELKSAIENLKAKIKKKKLQKKELLGKIGTLDKELSKQGKINVPSIFIRCLVESSYTETGHVLFLIDYYAELAGIEFSKAHEQVKTFYKECSPKISFPTENELIKLRDLWKDWYNSHATPSFIKTVCDWHCSSVVSEIPFIFYRFIPGLQERLSEEYVGRYFYLLFPFKISKRKGIIDLFLDRYVVYYSLKNDDTHMCVVSKEELEYLKDRDDLQSCEFSDEVLNQHIHKDPCKITQMTICLPRGDTSCLEDDGYKYKEFKSLVDMSLCRSIFCAPKCKVRIAYNDKPQFDVTLKKGDDGKYVFEPSLNKRQGESITSVELYLFKGKSPFK